MDHPPAATTILRTKLRPPVETRGLIARPRLLGLLERNPRRPLTVVSAPAGYGKTTLVTQWLEDIETQPAWLQLDEDDSELRTFLSYFIAAVQVRFPKACPATGAVLEAAQLPPVSLLADTLSNDLDSVPEPFVLVLDDYHLVSNAEIHELLDALMRYPPRPLHLVLVTRHDPAMSLASLQARGWLTEIRQDDLRFTKTEMKAVLRQMADLSVHEATLDHLEEQLEGWIVGLHLVGLVLRNQPAPEAFLIGLKGGFQQVYEYLSEQVLGGQTAAVRQGLLQTSVLNRFCISLVEAVCTDAEDPAATISGEDFIQQVQLANLFVVPLDSHDEWFRYHHLFQDLLKRQLERSYQPSDIASLNSRASEWFECQGLITDAIEHALSAEDAVRAAEIIERYRGEEFAADRWYTVEHWLAMLPADVRQQRPKLLMTEAWIAICRFQVARIPMIIEQVDVLLREQKVEPTVLGELAYFRGFLEYWQGHAELSQQHFNEALSKLKGEKTPYEGEAELLLGLAFCMEGKERLAVQRLEEKIERLDPSQNQLKSRLVGGLAFIHSICGDLRRSRLDAQRLQLVASKLRIRNTKAWASYLQACSHLNAGELGAATSCFADAAELRYVLEARATVDALAGLALCQQLRQLEDEADETVNLLQEFTRDLNERQYLSVANSIQSRLALLRGDSTQALQWARSANEEAIPSTLFLWLEAPPMTQARVLITAGSKRDLARAIQSLEAIRAVSESCRFTCQTIEAAVLQSVALDRQGLTEDAFDALDEALALAEKGGWVRPFVELGQPMASLLQRAPLENVSIEFVDRLMDAIPEIPKAEVSKSSGQARTNAAVVPSVPAGAEATSGTDSYVEPLTNRELETLQLLAERLYDKEIAKALSISVWTVRTHVKHIFEKLHVSNRRQAVVKAEELGLLK
ncbi:HTH-type transcriptional regulator MalT [Planctomycetes bacterium CA13]|uniref:HTH-type transcriptional regulator MalT n=1 Tax=Novipirellula herctigrandis TaxID=2527986 RepID=A0A5C5Z2R6_9BACT|nr:HTH-type transcriptional regulator MalT [Planctomycetes bacterium CA13]